MLFTAPPFYFSKKTLVIILNLCKYKCQDRCKYREAEMKQADVIIIGNESAALQLAKELRHDLNVIILTKSKLENSNSYLAQGGIAAAISKSDSPHKHFIDS